MTGSPAGLIFDSIILVLLGITIVYAARLSVYFRRFRDSRSDLEKLIKELSQNITRAEAAIADMRDTAEHSGRHLQNILDESKFLCDELRFMNESGDNLATRLEKLAERNRELVDLLQSSGGIGQERPLDSSSMGRTVQQPRTKTTKRPAQKPDQVIRGFSIHDRDFDEPVSEGDLDEQGIFPGEENENTQVSFQSRAERELYEALHKPGRRKKPAGGVL